MAVYAGAPPNHLTHGTLLSTCIVQYTNSLINKSAHESEMKISWK